MPGCMLLREPMDAAKHRPSDRSSSTCRSRRKHYLVQLGKKAGTEDWHLSCHSHSHLRQGKAKAVRERHLASSCLSSLSKHASRSAGHTAAASTCSAA